MMRKPESFIWDRNSPCRCSVAMSPRVGHSFQAVIFLALEHGSHAMRECLGVQDLIESGAPKGA